MSSARKTQSPEKSSPETTSQEPTTPAAAEGTPAAAEGTPEASEAAEAPPAKKPSRRSPAPRPDEMTGDVLEFITAIDEYKRAQQRPFPSWSEILEVVKGLGYTR